MTVHRLFRALLSAAVFAMSVVPQAMAQTTGPCTVPIQNPVLCENTRTGNPSTEWDISGSGDATIQGFASDISANKGTAVNFKIRTSAAAYRLDIYRLGYYAGMGARRVATILPSASLPQNQPACLSDATTGLVDCGNWATSASWAIPSDAVSGVYIARLVRTDTNGASHIVFIVRDDTASSPVLFQTSDTTWQAYNDFGGNSLYSGSPAGRAYKVSYNRPFATATTKPESWLFNAEYPMLRWLEANGFNVSYASGIDTDRRGAAAIQTHRVFMSVGHDEYWSAAQRANVEAARGAGVNLAFFSGNEMFWKTRWENSIDGSATTYRTLVSYKETHAGAVIDPQDPPTWTGTWRDPRFSPPADGGRPENALTGTLFMVNGTEYDTLTVSSNYSRLRFWRNTSVATLGSGQSANLTGGCNCILGYEWDEAPDANHPAGLIRMSSTTVNVPAKLQDYGNTYAPGSATHSLTLYRATSGALVFSAGSVDWSWGLDTHHNGQASTVEPALQQATLNLLADMGQQPGSIQPGLVAATASTDTTPPLSSISSPVAGSTEAVGDPVSIVGTANDAGGGVVGGVEVSTDNGATWHLATGTTNWSYSWTPSSQGNTTIRSRAADDSGNIEAPAAGVNVSVGTATCPCSIWSPSATPAIASQNDSGSVELGLKFRSDSAGYITGVSFYKGAGNSGTHAGSLWSSTGTLLGQATFSGETASGWQQASFPSPVAIAANSTYVVSYHAPNGHYALNQNYFTTTGVDNAPLHALVSGGASGTNGVYNYSTGSTFPSNSFAASNYWVDAIFVTSIAPDTTPPVISAVQSTNVSNIGATISWTTNEPSDTQVDYGTTTAYGSSTALNTSFVVSHSQTLSGLTASTLYHYRVKSRDAAGNLATSGDFTLTTSAPDTTPPTITNVQPSSIGSSGATITWTTDEVADSQIDFGTTAAYGSSTTLDTNAVTNHSQTLSGLSSNTLYHYRVKSRDPSANLATSGDFTFTTAALANCPCSIWSPSATPATASQADSGSVELGVKFRSDAAGYISGIRFYKGSGNTGTHVGSLWSSTGALMGQATFSGESASGWQQVSFGTPVAINANTTYVASYHAPSGGYSLNQNYFTSSGVDNTPLHALASGVDGTNAVYNYSTTSSFPTNSFASSNYWVDVVFVTSIAPDTTPPVISSVQATGIGSSGATLTWTTNEVSDSQVDYGTTTAYGSSTAVNSANVTSHSQTLSGLSVSTVYHYRVKSRDPSNNLATSGDFTFTTTTPDTTPPVISAVQATSIGSTAATITWTTNEIADTQVDYGTTTAYGSSTTLDTTAVTSHSQTLNGLSSSTLYHYRVKSRDPSSNLSTSGDFTFTTAASVTCQPCTIWPSTATPSIASQSDSGSVELGVKLRSDAGGYITGIRFYKGPANSGTHVGSLWSSTGVLLAQATFTAETTSGWQQVTFPTPVAITANTTYIASYHAPGGGYSLNQNYFTGSGVDSAPLHALADGVAGGDGVYNYSAGSSFPTNSFASSNYWVDVLFQNSLP
jgi:hypothetical protein